LRSNGTTLPSRFVMVAGDEDAIFFRTVWLFLLFWREGEGGVPRV
jgi:hypothetical protein